MRIYIYIPPNMPSEVMFMHDTCTSIHIYIYIYIYIHQPPEHVCVYERTYACVFGRLPEYVCQSAADD